MIINLNESMRINVFGLGEGGGFLAQKLNRRTELEPTTKLSYEALHPPLRQTAVTTSAYWSAMVCRSICCFHFDCLLSCGGAIIKISFF